MNTKKLLSLVLVLVLALSLSVAAMAADGDVAAVGEDKYTTLQAAIDAANGGTVTLLANVEESVVITAGKTVTLDLGHYTLKNGAAKPESVTANDTISNKGTLTIIGTGTVENSANAGAVVNYPGAVANLNGGTYTVNKWYTLKNMGTMTLSSGVTITTTNGGASSLIDNGWYGNNSNDRNTTYGANTAYLTINGGNFEGGMNTVKNDDYGDLTITDGTFSNMTGPAIMNWNTAEIRGGDFTAPNSGVVANGYLSDDADKGELTITGGTFTAGDGSGVLFAYNVGATDGKGKMEISNATFNGIVGGDDLYDVVINSGTFNSKVDPSYIADGKASASLTSGDETAYYIGTGAEVAEKLETAADGDKIEVMQGDVDLELADGVVVSNSGDGKVTANNEPVTDEEVTAHVHDAKPVAAKEATCTEDGNIAYWYCENCGKYFKDEALKEEITKDATIVKATGHENVKHVEAKPATTKEEGNIEYWYCEDCGRYFKDEALKVEIKKEDTVIKVTGEEKPDEKPEDPKDPSVPQTGDSSVMTIVLAVMALSAAGAAAVTVLKSRKNHN